MEGAWLIRVAAEKAAAMAATTVARRIRPTQRRPGRVRSHLPALKSLVYEYSTKGESLKKGCAGGEGGGRGG